MGSEWREIRRIVTLILKQGRQFDAAKMQFSLFCSKSKLFLWLLVLLQKNMLNNVAARSLVKADGDKTLDTITLNCA